MGARAGTVRRVAVVLVCGLLAWFAGRVDWRATLAVLRGASLGLLALSLTAELLSVAAKGLRWWLFLRPLGSRGPALAIRATFAGAGFNNVLIGNGGEAARALLVTRALGASSARVLATLALDRAWEAVGFGAVLVGTAALTPLPPTLARVRPAVLATVGLLAAALLVLARLPAPAPRPAHTAGHRDGGPPAPLPRLVAYLGRFARSLAELSTGRRSAGAFLLTLAVWATQAATYALAAAAAGVQLGAAGHLVTLLTVNLGFAVRTTPGGVGVFQALYALAARSFGVPAPTAVAAAILIQAVQIIPITALGLAAAPELLRRRVAAPDAA